MICLFGKLRVDNNKVCFVNQLLREVFFISCSAHLSEGLIFSAREKVLYICINVINFCLFLEIFSTLFPIRSSRKNRWAFMKLLISDFRRILLMTFFRIFSAVFSGVIL
jgi:hypothetical protein